MADDVAPVDVEDEAAEEAAEAPAPAEAPAAVEPAVAVPVVEPAPIPEPAATPGLGAPLFGLTKVTLVWDGSNLSFTGANDQILGHIDWHKDAFA